MVRICNPCAALRAAARSRPLPCILSTLIMLIFGNFQALHGPWLAFVRLWFVKGHALRLACSRYDSFACAAGRPGCEVHTAAARFQLEEFCTSGSCCSCKSHTTLCHACNLLCCRLCCAASEAHILCLRVTSVLCGAGTGTSSGCCHASTASTWSASTSGCRRGGRCAPSASGTQVAALPPPLPPSSALHATLFACLHRCCAD